MRQTQNRFQIVSYNYRVPLAARPNQNRTDSGSRAGCFSCHVEDSSAPVQINSAQIVLWQHLVCVVMCQNGYRL